MSPTADRTRQRDAARARRRQADADRARSVRETRISESLAARERQLYAAYRDATDLPPSLPVTALAHDRAPVSCAPPYAGDGQDPPTTPKGAHGHQELLTASARRGTPPSPPAATRRKDEA